MKKVENKDDELKDVAPALFSIEKKEVFTVPANYFDSLPEEIMKTISADVTLKETAEVNPFSVPENYFEKLPVAISNKITEEQRHIPSLSPIPYFLHNLLRPKYSLSLITACLAFIFCIRFFEKPILLTVNGGTTQTATISETDILGEVDEGTLESAISEEKTIAFKTKPTAADKKVEDYIINNNIDITDIANEL